MSPGPCGGATSATCVDMLGKTSDTSLLFTYSKNIHWSLTGSCLEHWEYIQKKNGATALEKHKWCNEEIKSKSQFSRLGELTGKM